MSSKNLNAFDETFILPPALFVSEILPIAIRIFCHKHRRAAEIGDSSQFVFAFVFVSVLIFVFVSVPIIVFVLWWVELH